MALDRQKILNELGNVVNQLQNADCGCMGKLFSNSSQENYNQGSPMACPNGGYNMQGFQGHCHGYGHGHCPGYNSPCAGEPCTRRCSGFCDTPKVYDETYNYLNRNLMQPVVQEVYQDLKSITPENTIMNSPMGAPMGMHSHNANANQGNMGQHSTPSGYFGNPNMSVGHVHQPHSHFGNVAMSNPNSQGMDQGMNQTGYGHGAGHMEHGMAPIGQEGMGAMGHEPGMAQMTPEYGNVQMAQAQGIGHMGHGQVMGQNEHGQVMGQGMGYTELGMGQGQGMHNMHHGMIQSRGIGNMGQNIVNMMSSSSKLHKMPKIGNPPSNMIPPPEMGHGVDESNQGQRVTGQMLSNPGHMHTDNMHHRHPGMQTTQYMSQQNTFPGAAENGQSNHMHGNMNQMIPGSRPTGNMNATPKRDYSAYGTHGAGIAKFNETFPGLMNGDLGFDPMAIAIQMNPANQQNSALNTIEKLMMDNSKGVNKLMDNRGNASPQMQPVINAANAVGAKLNEPPKHEEPGQPIETQQNDQIPQKLHKHPQQLVCPNTGAILSNPPVPAVYEGSEDLKNNYRYPPRAPDMYKDPLIPADTSRHFLQSHHFQHLKLPKDMDYNTIGQPVERLYTDNPLKYSNLKPTVSKTALIGNKPIGKTPSRTQQQHIYNQYKGSQSYTQQNIKPTHHHNVSHSDPRIALPQQTLQAPIEKFNGDSAANDQLVPVETKYPNDNAKQAPVKNVKLRNGLQDQVYSASPTSAKWSFHGTHNPVTYTGGYRMRTKGW